MRGWMGCYDRNCQGRRMRGVCNLALCPKPSNVSGLYWQVCLMQASNQSAIYDMTPMSGLCFIIIISISTQCT